MFSRLFPGRRDTLAVLLLFVSASAVREAVVAFDVKDVRLCFRKERPFVRERDSTLYLYTVGTAVV